MWTSKTTLICFNIPVLPIKKQTEPTPKNPKKQNQTKKSPTSKCGLYSLPVIFLTTSFQIPFGFGYGHEPRPSSCRALQTALGPEQGRGPDAESAGWKGSVRGRRGKGEGKGGGKGVTHPDASGGFSTAAGSRLWSRKETGRYQRGAGERQSTIVVLVLFPAVPLGTELGAELTRPSSPWMEAGQGLRRFPVPVQGADTRRGRRCQAWRQRCEGRPRPRRRPQFSFWRLCFCPAAGVGTDRRTLCWPCELGSTSGCFREGYRLEVSMGTCLAGVQPLSQVWLMSHSEFIRSQWG